MEEKRKLNPLPVETCVILGSTLHKLEAITNGAPCQLDTGTCPRGEKEKEKGKGNEGRSRKLHKAINGTIH